MKKVVFLFPKGGFFIFLLPEQKKNETKRKFAVCIFLPTPVLFSAKEKELAPLKQLFLFNAPKSTYASRQKKEAGPWCFLGRGGDNIASLVRVDVFHFTYHQIDTPQTAKRIWIPMGFRHLVEERKENRANFREEQKAVWATASSFCLGNSPDF